MAASRLRFTCLKTLKQFGALLLFAFALFCHCSASRAADMTRRVLILHAYNYSNPSMTDIATAARDRLRQGVPQRVEIDAEFLNLARIPDSDQESRQADFLRERYARNTPEVIIALGDAVFFVLRHRDAFPATIPVVFVALSPESQASAPPLSNMTGTVFDTTKYFTNTLALAEALQPDAPRLFVIAGNGSLDRRWQATARKVIGERPRRYQTTYLFDLSYNGMLEEVRRIPPDSIIIMLTFFQDITGKPFTPIDLAETVVKMAPAPMYAPYYSPLGMGFVGGSSETFESMGVAAADMALQILSGTPASALPVLSNPTQSYRVDFKAMEKWGLKESNLPPGTTVLFKDPSIWDEHRDFVLATMLVVALQSIFVGVLLLERRRRLRAETLLTESEERMTFTAAAVNVGLWQYNPKTEEVWFTEPCRALLGFSADAALTRASFVAAIHPDDRHLATSALRQAVEANQTANSEIRIIWPNGQTRWIRIGARAHPASDLKPKQLSGTLIDITDQKSVELEAAQQRDEIAHLTRVSIMGELSGAIAHEINQPLTAILANAQAALQMLPNSPDVAEVREALQDIVDEDNRAGQVIQKLRSLLKKEEGHLEMIDLNGLITSTIKLLNSELVGRRVNVALHLANDLPPILGDAVQVQQVLLNLIINGADAMTTTPAARRQISVVTTTQKGTVQVSVNDRGVGIRDGDEKKLFQPFYTTKNHGLGLGLMICSSIIQAHGGELVLSNGVNGGAEARFELPAAEAQREAAQ